MKTITVTMSATQAARIGKWLGDHYAHTLPLDVCREIHAVSVALRRGESCDVTALADDIEGRS